MSTATVSVMVKSLNGDLVQLDVDPSLGLDGVESALSHFDSDTYLQHTFKVFFFDEDQKELTQDTMLGLIAVQEPICELVTFQNDVILLDEVSCAFIYKVFTFKLTDNPGSNRTHVYVYVTRTMTSWSTADRLFTFSFQPLRRAPTQHQWNIVSLIHSMTDHDPSFLTSDAYVIEKVLRKYYPDSAQNEYHNYEIWKSNTTYCECGCTVKNQSMVAHLKTKQKHAKGDSKGKAFLKRVTAYVESLDASL